MRLDVKEEILFKEIISIMNDFDNLDILSYVMLKSLQNIVCIKFIKSSENKKCSMSCPLNCMGMCREITSFCKHFDNQDLEEF